MFEDRVDAGNKLVTKLEKYKNKSNVFVVGITRGGLRVAKTISQKLNLRILPLIIKKISLAPNEELAIGAIVSPKDIYWNEDLCKKFNIDLASKQKLALEKFEEIKLLKQNLNMKFDFLILKGKTVLLVDDGVATGASVIAASNFLRRIGVEKIILATPVISFDIYKDIKKYFDRFIYLITSKDFYSVGQFYNNFPQISDEETAKIIKS